MSKNQKLVRESKSLDLVLLHLQADVSEEMRSPSTPKPAQNPQNPKKKVVLLTATTHQLLTWRMVRPVSCASCFFCSSDGYGCCRTTTTGSSYLGYFVSDVRDHMITITFSCVDDGVRGRGGDPHSGARPLGGLSAR